MATRRTFQHDISNATQVDTSAPARAGAAIGQSIADTGAANATLLKQAGSMAIEANQAYQEVDLANKINETTDQFFRETQAISNARSERDAAQFATTQAQRDLSEDAAGNTFYSDQAQATITDAEKKLKEKQVLLDSAIKSGQLTPDQAMRRMAVDLRKSIATWPGMADKFRKIASQFTGVGDLENYELRAYYKQAEDATKERLATQKALRENAEKEAAKLYPIVASKGMSLEQLTQSILVNDPAIMPYRTLYGVREEADAALKFINNNSNAVLETQGRSIMTNYGVQAMGLISTQASNFLAQMQKEGNMAKYLNTNGTFNMNTFQELATKNTAQMVQFQSTMSYALDESFRSSMLTLERTPGLGATAMQTARQNLIKNHEDYKKMLASADGVALIYNSLLSQQKEGLQVAAQTLSSVSSAAGLLGVQQYMPQYLANRDAFANTEPGKVLVPIMDRLRDTATAVVNPLTDAAKAANGVRTSGVLPATYASTDEAKYVVGDVDLSSRDAMRKIAQRGAEGQMRSDDDVKQYQDAFKGRMALVSKFTAAPGTTEYRKYVQQAFNDPAYQTVLKNMVPADREQWLAGLATTFDAAIESKKTDLDVAISKVTTELTWNGVKDVVKPVLVQDATGALVVRWNVDESKIPAAQPTSTGNVAGRGVNMSASRNQPAPFTKVNGQWQPNFGSNYANDQYVQEAVRRAAEINELARTKQTAMGSADGKINSSTDKLLPENQSPAETKRLGGGTAPTGNGSQSPAPRGTTEKSMVNTALQGGIDDLSKTIEGLRTTLKDTVPGSATYKRIEADIATATTELEKLRGKS